MQPLTVSSADPPTDLYKIYVDANVFHYLAVGWPPKNEHAKRALTTLSDATQGDTIICVTSSITLAEEYDACKGRAFIKCEMDRGNIRWTPFGVTVNRSSAEPLDSNRRARAVRDIRKGLRNSVIRLEDPSNWPTDLMDLFCCRSNLHWPDALHLAIALALRCDYIVTNDKDFYQEMSEKLTATTGGLHHPASRILASIYGIPKERLQRPLIEPLYLSHPDTITTLASLS